MQKTWFVLPHPPQSFFEQFPELPKTVASLLFHRNIRTQAQIDEFLNPDYSKDVHDPYLFRDMERSVKRIFKAIEKQEKIVVHGDYDADGVSASTILVSTLKALGATAVDVYIPHRETEGYGLNSKTVEKLAQQQVSLLITCDCGISNVEEVRLAQKKNIDVIITDHHAGPKKLPKAYAIIHPGVPEETYPDKGLAGGGVAFKLMQGLLKKHAQKNKTLPDGTRHEAFEKWMLDMVAIASVADMVPLRGESRTLTKYGLIVLNRTKRKGLQKLLLEARLTEENGTKKRELDSYTIGFQIAPRINAAGRMNHANVAYNLMMADSDTETVELAYKLDQNNQERQKITEELVKRASMQVEEFQKESPFLFVLGEGWSTGIVGLIAGKLKEKYYKPTIVMAENGDEITGSGRSVSGYDLIQGLQSMPQLFSKFGGHPMACGFTLVGKEMLEEFKQTLTAHFVNMTKGLDVTPTLTIDAEISMDEVNWEMYDVLEKFKPFGQTNEQPKYLVRNLEVYKLEPVGKDGKHLRILVKHKGKIIKTIGWRLCNENGNGTNWCNELKPADRIDLVFEIDVNEWNGNRELQLTIVDLRLSS